MEYKSQRCITLKKNTLFFVFIFLLLFIYFLLLLFKLHLSDTKTLFKTKTFKFEPKNAKKLGTKVSSAPKIYMIVIIIFILLKKWY